MPAPLLHSSTANPSDGGGSDVRRRLSGDNGDGGLTEEGTERYTASLQHGTTVVAPTAVQQSGRPGGGSALLYFALLQTSPPLVLLVMSIHPLLSDNLN